MRGINCCYCACVAKAVAALDSQSNTSSWLFRQMRHRPKALALPTEQYVLQSFWKRSLHMTYIHSGSNKISKTGRFPRLYWRAARLKTCCALNPACSEAMFHANHTQLSGCHQNCVIGALHSALQILHWPGLLRKPWQRNLPVARSGWDEERKMKLTRFSPL